MKQCLTYRAAIFFFVLTIASVGCSKAELENEQLDPSEKIVSTTGVQIGHNRIAAGGVIISAPTEVDANDPFDILVELECGRVALERGYILGADNSKIYKNITCGTPGILWEVVVDFVCYTGALSWTGSIAEHGTYIYRTRHNAADNNCDVLGSENTTGDCSFTGSEVYCFMITVKDPCANKFKGRAMNCSSIRQAIYEFTSKDGEAAITIEGSLLNFSGANAAVTVSGASLTVTQTTATNPVNRIIRLEGAIGACQTVTITVNWTSPYAGGIITGNWTVKNASGTDLAPPVAGLKCADE